MLNMEIYRLSIRTRFSNGEWYPLAKSDGKCSAAGCEFHEKPSDKYRKSVEVVLDLRSGTFMSVK